jgi:hypothetical protein
MAKKVMSLEDLKRLSPERLRQLYLNAAKHPDGQYIRDLVDQHGLPLSSGGLTLDDPIHRKMVEIVWSTEGQKAALEATAKGLPALCGVDPLLRSELGDLYGKHDMGTASAGAIVAEVMRHKGYTKAESRPCPPGCVAMTGVMWR